MHPDKNHAPKSEEAFKKVSGAYCVLRDEEKRKVYDEQGAVCIVIHRHHRLMLVLFRKVYSPPPPVPPPGPRNLIHLRSIVPSLRMIV